MQAELTDMVALITGSGTRLGAATARRLAAEGAAVALVAQRRDQLDELASAICRDDGTALVVQADVTRQREAASAVQRTVAQLGRLDIVVNMLLGAREAAFTMPGLRYVTHAALLDLVRSAGDSPRGVADLVTVSSADDPTRSGVVAFAEAIRREMRGQHVRVSVVASDAADTELIADAVAYIVVRDRRVTVSEILLCATGQPG